MRRDQRLCLRSDEPVEAFPADAEHLGDNRPSAWLIEPDGGNLESIEGLAESLKNVIQRLPCVAGA
jgi:hypothetical protein